MIPLSVPNFSGSEREYVLKAIEAEWVSTGGEYVQLLEKKIAQYLGIDSAVACQSGTAGLHLALLLAGVKPGDEVIVPALTFIASINPIKYIHAEPVFMDCDDTLNMDLEKLKDFLCNECDQLGNSLINRKTNKKIAAVVIVHVFGNMADVERLMEMAAKFNLKVIEDATEALGTFRTKGTHMGKFAGTVGDFGVYSFNGNKIITTGGGGMLVAKDPALAEKARYLSTQAKDDSVYYIHNDIGYNYRMTNLQGALGVAQLEQLDNFILIKRKNYLLYTKLLQEIEGLTLLPFNSGTRPNYWFYSLVIDEDKYGEDRDGVLNRLYRHQIQSRPVWRLNHLQHPYQCNQAYKIEKAYSCVDKILNIPCSTNLKKEDIEKVIEALKK
jgi:perosamine synthetase